MIKIKNFLTFTTVNLILAASIGCSLSQKNLTGPPPPPWGVERFEFTDRPEIGKMPKGQTIHLGGFSGLVYIDSNPNGSEHRFLTITDRGPNADLLKMHDKKEYHRPFLIPKFNPTLVYLTASTKDHSLKVTKRISLKGPNGSLLTGLPPTKPDVHGSFEIPVDPTTGNALKEDILGLDTECVAIAKDGSFWVGEEYRPAILKFSKAGILQEMYVPVGYFSETDLTDLKKRFGTNTFVRQFLPKELTYRRVNRGFEGLTIKDDKIIATLQSPVERPDAKETFTRWIVLDPSKIMITELRYQTSDIKENRIGDLSARGEQIYVIEQNGKTGPNSMHSIYAVAAERVLTGAVSTFGGEKSAAPQPMPKALVVDMVASGVHEFEKVEGIALLDENRIATINDNDFGLTFEGEIGVDHKKPVTLTIFHRPAKDLPQMKKPE